MIFYKCYNLEKKPNNEYLLHARSRKVGCIDRREMEKQRRGVGRNTCPVRLVDIFILQEDTNHTQSAKYYLLSIRDSR
jgi:hypothetical protein